MNKEDITKNPLYAFVVETISLDENYHPSLNRDERIKIAMQTVMEYMACELEQHGGHEMPREMAVPNLAREYKEGFDFLTDAQSYKLAGIVYDKINGGLDISVTLEE